MFRTLLASAALTIAFATSSLALDPITVEDSPRGERRAARHFCSHLRGIDYVRCSREVRREMHERAGRINVEVVLVETTPNTFTTFSADEATYLLNQRRNSMAKIITACEAGGHTTGSCALTPSDYAFAGLSRPQRHIMASL